MDDPARRLHHYLSGQAFPAARWELIATAEAFGADGRTRSELRAIPPATYRDVPEVVRAILRAGRRPAA